MRLLITIVLMSLLAASTHAQNPKVVVVGGAPKYDAQKSFGLKAVASATTEAPDNYTKLQAKVDAGRPYILYPWYFPAADIDNHPIYSPYSFSKTLVTSRAGQTWEGNSRGAFQATNHLHSPKLCLPTAYATTFDGSTNKLTSTGASATAKVFGRTVDERSDQYGSVIVAESAELQTNGTFTGNADGWTLAGGATYGSDAVSTTTGAGTIAQNTSATRGRFYRIVYTVSGIAAGGQVRAEIGGRTNHLWRTANGTYTEFIPCGADANAPLIFTFDDTDDDQGPNNTDGTATVDNVILNQAAWYGIESIDEENNTWTLDRNWCSGEVTNGTGYYCPTLIRDHGRCNTYRGLIFSAPVSAAGENQIIGSIGIHVTSQPTLNQGKHLIERCYFHGYQVAVLSGRHLAEWGDAYDEFAGSQDTGTHADHMNFAHCFVHHCEVFYACRNLQSVVHRMYDINTDNCGAICRADRGGKVYIDGPHLQGPGTLMRKRVFLIGQGVSASTGLFVARDISMDGSVRNPMLIETENRQSVLTAVFDGCNVTRDANTTAPLVDVQGPCSITISNFHCGSTGAGSGTFNSLCKDDVVMVSSAGGVPYLRVYGSIIGNVDAAGKKCTAVTDILTASSVGYAEFGGNILHHATNGRQPGRPGIWNATTKAWVDVTTLSLFKQDSADTLLASTRTTPLPRFTPPENPFAVGSPVTR